MIVVMQCAASKRSDAGCLVKPDGTPVVFVARPENAPGSGSVSYARPDDDSGLGCTWRQHLIGYNRSLGSNPLNLARAFELYENEAYRNLVKALGERKVYILSAGWGLVPSTFLTPLYDITFNGQADLYKRRRRSDLYDDFRLLPNTREDVIFIGSQSYVPLFCRLTDYIKGARYVFHNTQNPPGAPGCKVVHFESSDRYRWFYACANTLAGSAFQTRLDNSRNA